MRYIRCTLELHPPQPATEIFIATLSELGFESFEETDTGVKAYIQESHWNEDDFKALPLLDNPEWNVQYGIEYIEPQNWNAVWEQDYTPITVGELCMVRAPFHPEPPARIQYDIVISPKMSFGTGHHQTTCLMLDCLLEMDLKEKAVLDVGSGTGVLAILAGMKGAGPIVAVDIDRWAFENCRENILRNGQEGIEVLKGDITSVKERKFDVVLANINKNVLLSQMEAYAEVLVPDGLLLLSGFFLKDLPDLRKSALEAGLKFERFREQEHWVAMVLRPESGS
ncbi:MAG: 50S ribosomal protein L11 methyltransferase [Robiginitalea sp.]|jgi:ribosomal protein L11 methyltransferase